MLSLFLLDTLKFYRQNLLYLCAIMLPIIIPLEIGQILIHNHWQTQLDDFRFLFYSAGLSFMVYPFYQAALVVGVQHALNGRYPPALQLIKEGHPYWIPLLLINALYYCGLVTGLFMFVIPGIFVAIRWSLAELNAVLDGENPVKAMASSFTETAEIFWPIFFGMVIITAGNLTIVSTLSWLIETMTHNSTLQIVPAIVGDLLYPLAVIFLFRIRHYLQDNR